MCVDSVFTLRYTISPNETPVEGGRGRPLYDGRRREGDGAPERVLVPRAAIVARPVAILPAYCTGLGKALLAYRPEAEVAAWAATQKFAALTPRTITSAKRLLKELRIVHERGYAVDDQEREKGVRCLAAPVRNH